MAREYLFSFFIFNCKFILIKRNHYINNTTKITKLSFSLWYNFYILNNDISVIITNFLHVKVLSNQMCASLINEMIVPSEKYCQIILLVTGITESKLGDSVLSSEIHIGNYNTIRCDRSYKTNNLSYDVKSFSPPETEKIFLNKML